MVPPQAHRQWLNGTTEPSKALTSKEREVSSAAGSLLQKDLRSRGKVLKSRKEPLGLGPILLSAQAPGPRPLEPLPAPEVLSSHVLTDTELQTANCRGKCIDSSSVDSPSLFLTAGGLQEEDGTLQGLLDWLFLLLPC